MFWPTFLVGISLNLSCKDRTAVPPQGVCATWNPLAEEGGAGFAGEAGTQKVAVATCRRGSERVELCPLGTVCEQDAEVCEIPTSLPRRTEALIVDFDVREFELELESDSSWSYRWVRPPEADQVSCFLFTCPPRIEGPAGSRTIVNFEQCAHSQRLFPLDEEQGPREEFTFSLASMHDLEAKSCVGDGERPKDAATTNEFGVPRITSLQLGCLAHDLNKTVAATELINLTPEDLPAYTSLPATECAGSEVGQDANAMEGQLCWVVGTCRGEVCDASAGKNPNDSRSTRFGPCRSGDEGRNCASRDDLGICRGGRCVACSASGTDQCSSNLESLPLVIGSCASGTDLLNCFPATGGGIGSCDGGVCRNRCRIQDDCALSAIIEGAGTCVPKGNDEYLGVCVSPQEEASE